MPHTEMEPLTPVYTASLFRPLHDELMRLLRGLASDNWLRPTLAGHWRVRDVAAHLLDGDLRKLSTGRDGHVLSSVPVRSFEEVVQLINGMNASGVGYGGRLSPQVIVDLLDVTGPWVADFVGRLPPHADALYPVAWAQEERSAHWMDIGREYTERWHHQMQIREAVGASRLLARHWFDPVLDLSVRAFPRAYEQVTAAEGTVVVFDVAAEGPSCWSVVRDARRWVVLRGRPEHPAAVVSTDGDTAWKLLFNGLPVDRAMERVVVTGERTLAAPMLSARAVMV